MIEGFETQLPKHNDSKQEAAAEKQRPDAFKLPGQLAVSFRAAAGSFKAGAGSFSASFRAAAVRAGAGG